MDAFDFDAQQGVDPGAEAADRYPEHTQQNDCPGCAELQKLSDYMQASPVLQLLTMKNSIVAGNELIVRLNFYHGPQRIMERVQKVAETPAWQEMTTEQRVGTIGRVVIAEIATEAEMEKVREGMKKGVGPQGWPNTAEGLQATLRSVGIDAIVVDESSEPTAGLGSMPPLPESEREDEDEEPEQTFGRRDAVKGETEW